MSLPTPAWVTSPPPDPAGSTSHRAFVVGGLLVGGGVVVGVVCMIVGFVALANAIGAVGVVGVPGHATGRLQAGRYVIEDAYSYSSYGTEVPDITVYTPTGDEVAVTEVAARSRTQGDLATFVAPMDGVYEVVVEVPRFGDTWDLPSSVRVTRDDSELGAAAVPWFLGGLLGGGGMVVAGIVVLIVAAVGRSRARRRPPPGSGWAPPAWPAPTAWPPAGAPAPGPWPPAAPPAPGAPWPPPATPGRPAPGPPAPWPPPTGGPAGPAPPG